MIKARGITHGNKYLRKTLIECVWGASRTKVCFYARFSHHQTVVRRKCRMKVQVAIARKMLSAIWFVLLEVVAYRDFNGGCQRRLTTATAYTALCKVIIFVVARPRFANWLMLCAA